MAWQANHDIQYGCVMHICDDMIKAHKGKSILMTKLVRKQRMAA